MGGFSFEVLIKHPGVALCALGAFLLMTNEFINSIGTDPFSGSVNSAGWFLLIIGFIVIFAQIVFMRRI